MSSVGRKRLVRNAIATLSAAALVGSCFAGGATPANSAPSTPSATGQLAKALPKSKVTLAKATASALPKGVPTKGHYAFLLALDTTSTLKAFNGAKSKGTAAAKTAAQAQFARIKTAQASVIAALPTGSRVLYKTHGVMAGVAVDTDVRNYAALRSIHGVTQIYPVAPKKINNSYSVPFVGAANAWQNTGVTGENTTIAIIDTGIDYTHANFGGPGTKAAYDTALAGDGGLPDPALFPSAKIVGGVDFAGDDYNADPADPAYQPIPNPDFNPLDCNGHGSHVGGTAAGFGVTDAGATYGGPYGVTTPFSTMRIGPGMAPAAELYAYKVFGCEGSSDVVGQAIDFAADPNQDGDPSDHVDVINMSLGSDYGSPQDADSFLSNLATLAGITVVVASGNGGDYYDVGGSPGDAVGTIAVANSVDAQSIVDALVVSAPGSIDGDYAAERSVAYDWENDSDLSGTVVALSQVGNEDGCDPFNAADTTAVAGKIAFLEWTDNGVRRCGSAGRSLNARNAGASGFILADDEETFSAGITGDTDIPGVLVVKSAGDAIRDHLGESVTISGTVPNGFTQTITADNDTLNTSSSRGVRNAGNVKPDVTGVGTSVFSTAMGTGDEGISFSGTSMATPEVAGLAALVRSIHPSWTPEEVKADIMNTANHDLFTGQNQTGARYAPNRVGSGRIDARQAVSNDVIAYVANDPGAVSVSFGTLQVTAPVTLTKTVTVANKSANQVAYNIFYSPLTTIPGVQYTVSAPSVTVAPNSTSSFNVTLSIPNPATLTKTIDPTMATEQAGNPREFLADASGRLALLPTQGAEFPLRVPVYSAPRPASTMTQQASIAMPHGAVQIGGLTLSGHGVAQGAGAASIDSLVAGFELQGVSGLAPNCSVSITTGCVHFPDERSADLKYVGATSNAPQLAALGENAVTNGFVYFAIATQAPWHTVASQQEFDVLIDVDGDNEPDFAVFNGRYNDQDIMVANLLDLHSGDILDTQLINDRLGDTDTALFDSDAMVMPVSVQALGLTSSNPRFTYGVASYSNAASDAVDTVGVNPDTGNLLTPMSFNALRPGVAVYGSFSPSTSLLIFNDQPGGHLLVRKDVAAYTKDKGLGALMVHFHNKVGSKAQRVGLKSAPSVKLTLSKTSVQVHHSATVTVKVSGDAGFTPTGTIKLQLIGSGVIRTATLVNGTITFTVTPSHTGVYKFRADYGGDTNYIAANSVVVSLTSHS